MYSFILGIKLLDGRFELVFELVPDLAAFRVRVGYLLVLWEDEAQTIQDIAHDGMLVANLDSFLFVLLQELKNTILVFRFEQIWELCVACIHERVLERAGLGADFKVVLLGLFFLLLRVRLRWGIELWSRGDA